VALIKALNLRRFIACRSAKIIKHPLPAEQTNRVRREQSAKMTPSARGRRESESAVKTRSSRYIYIFALPSHLKQITTTAAHRRIYNMMNPNDSELRQVERFSRRM